MADNKKDAEPEKAAPKVKGKPNLLENKAVVLGAIVVAQAVVAIGLTQFVIVPRLGVGKADAGAPTGEAGALGAKATPEAKADKKAVHGAKPAAHGAKKAAHGGGAAAAGAEGGEGGSLADLPEIIVTLAGDSARPRYLRIGVNLELSDPSIVALVEARRPEMRDAVIMTLSDKTAAMLGTPEGKKRLRDEIFRRVAEKLPEGSLLNVYFSDLVVQ
jgi:flagellar basal body-associated protein FliL